MRKLSGEQIWLLLAERGEPMNAEEIAKVFGVEEKFVQEILRQEIRRFCPTKDGRWDLAFYHYVRPNHTFEEKAEIILCCAWFPLPDTILFTLLQRLCSEASEIEIRQRIKESPKFIFRDGFWLLSVWIYLIGHEEYEIVLRSLTVKKAKIAKLLQEAKEPVYPDELIHAVGLEEELERYAEIRQWSQIVRHLVFGIIQPYFRQLVESIENVIRLPSGRWIAISQERWQIVLNALQKTQRGFTTEEILRLVLQIQAEPIEQSKLLEHLEQRLRETDQVECINGKWFAKLPFVSRYDFYDPTTFVVMIEKGERIEVGSEKERWLREKGFYVLARLGGETDVVYD